MVVHKGESEITIEIVNLPATSARKSHTGEGGEAVTAATGETEMPFLVLCYFNHKSNQNEILYLALNCSIRSWKACCCLKV